MLQGRAINSIHLGPDDQRIVFSQRGQPWEALGMVRLDGSGWSRLTDTSFFHRLPVWSPDGQRLAFYMNRGGRLWTLRPDASGLTEILLPDGFTGGTYPVWSPDGSRIALAPDQGLIVIDPSSSPSRLVAQFDVGLDRSGATGGDGMRPFSWSPMAGSSPASPDTASATSSSRSICRRASIVC